MAEGVAAGEEVARGRWVNRYSPQGEPAGAGHQPLGEARGMKVGGHRTHWAWFGIRGEGLASLRPVGEEEGVGSLAKMGQVNLVKSCEQIFSDLKVN